MLAPIRMTKQTRKANKDDPPLDSSSCQYYSRHDACKFFGW
jgi:hypothetical protein